MTRKEFVLNSVAGAIINDNILLLQPKQNKEFSIEDAAEILQMFEKFRGTSCGFIIDKNQSYSLSSDMLTQGRDLMLQLGVKAIAYFSRTMAGKEAAKLEINLVKNYMSADLFETEEAAIDWISKVLAKE